MHIHALDHATSACINNKKYKGINGQSSKKQALYVLLHAYEGSCYASDKSSSPRDKFATENTPSSLFLNSTFSLLGSWCRLKMCLTVLHSRSESALLWLVCISKISTVLASASGAPLFLHLFRTAQTARQRIRAAMITCGVKRNTMMTGLLQVRKASNWLSLKFLLLRNRIKMSIAKITDVSLFTLSFLKGWANEWNKAK